MNTKKFFCCSSVWHWKYFDLGRNRWVEWKVKVIYLLDWCSKCKQRLGPDAAQLADIMCHTKCRQCYWAPAVKISTDLVSKQHLSQCNSLIKKTTLTWSVCQLDRKYGVIIDTLRVMSGAKSHVQLVVGLEPSLRHIRRILCLVCDDLSFLWGIARIKAFLPRKGRTFFRTTYVL